MILVGYVPEKTIALQYEKIAQVGFRKFNNGIEIFGLLYLNNKIIKK